jgi:Ca-activated chloride channel family protein
VYSQIKQQQVDPGLLQQDDDHEGTSAFSAKVFPIPAYGTKRIEMEYTEVLPVESLTSHFTFPLKPSFGDPQRVAEFSLHVHVLSDYPMSRLGPGTDSYPLKVTKSEANEFEGEYQATALELKDDFAFDYHINVPESALSWIAYRAPEQISVYDLRDPALATNNPDGYFEARAIFNQRGDAQRAPQQPRNVVLLLDTSLSMYGEKLKRAVEALDYFLHSLTPSDRFDLILFNEEATTLSATPLSATAENVERALDFIKNSALGGGTDLRKALTKSIELAPFERRTHIVLVRRQSHSRNQKLKANSSGTHQRRRVVGSRICLRLGKRCERRVARSSGQVRSRLLCASTRDRGHCDCS